MRICGSDPHSFESVKASVLASVFKKYEPEKRFCFLVVSRTLVLIGLLLLIWRSFHFEFIRGGDSKTIECSIFFSVCSALSLAVLIWEYFFLPKRIYKSLEKMKDRAVHFVFGDESISVKVYDEDGEKEEEIQYGVFVRVMETSRYFFVYPSKKGCFSIDKATITGGSAEELRDKMRQHSRQYILCKY